MTSVVGWFRVLKTIGAEPPVALMLTILGAKGYSMYMGPQYGGWGSLPASRDSLLFPGVLVETLDVLEDQGKPNNVYDLMRPTFDALWNTCGFDRSHNFDAAGVWKPLK